MRVTRKKSHNYIIPQSAWLASLFDSRFMVAATNTSGLDLDDALVQVTIPSGVTNFSANTVRVVDYTAIGTIDSHLLRYRAQRAPNSFYYVPVSVKDSILTIKALGKWFAGERRYWGVYWSTSNALQTYNYNHLGVNSQSTSSNSYVVGRVGPNTGDSNNGITSLALPLGPQSPYNFVSLKINGATDFQFMFTVYSRGNNRYGFTSATQNSVDTQNNFITVQGVLVDSQNIWSGSYTARFQNHMGTCAYSDGNGNWTNPNVHTVELQYTATVKTAYTATSNTLSVFRLWDSIETGLTSPGPFGTIPFFYQTPVGDITDAGQGVGVLPIKQGLIMGSSGVPHNSTTSGTSHAMVMRVNEFSVAGFGGVSTAGLNVTSDAQGFSIGFTDISQSTAIPAGAKVTLNLTLLLYQKGTVVGPDCLTAVEAVRLIHSADVIQGNAASIETFSYQRMTEDIERLSNGLIAGVEWIQTNAQKLTTLSWNYAYSYDLNTGLVGRSDDDDSTYGQAHVLHGLILRYKRTHDANLVPLIENATNYFIQLNATAESFFNNPPPTAPITGTHPEVTGMMPYWVFPGPGTYTETQQTGTWTYQIGWPRASCSLEQLQMSTHALWAYLTFLAEEDQSLFTKRSAIIALMQRMSQFEISTSNEMWKASSEVIDSSAQAVANALYMATNGQFGGNAIVSNGTTATSPVYGPAFSNWILINVSPYANFSDSNACVIQLFKNLYAKNTTNTGFLHWMYGFFEEIVTTDMNLYPVQTNSTITGTFGSFIDEFPVGWRPRETTLTDYYDSSRTPPHYIVCSDAGARDVLFGKTPHYAMVFGFLALMDPNYQMTVQSGITINITDLFMKTMHTTAANLIEPSTNVCRRGMSRYLGSGALVNDNLIDNCDLGYMLMAIEIYYLVKQRLAGTLNPSKYYRFPGTYPTAYTGP